MKLIYLDNNATTSVAPSVVKVIKRELKSYGNPSSLHFYGVDASNKLQKAREIIAKTINALPEEIFFTASGSESDNLCLKGFAKANKEKGNHIITTAIEHPAIINSCKHLEEQGFVVTYLSVDKDGLINLQELETAITAKTILVSIMHANNEIGSVQNIQAIGNICTKYSIPLHTDAVQSYLKIPFDVRELNVSLASFAGHKIHAPKGIGFIYKKKGIKLRREIDGGSQESALRAGTENVPYIIGLSEAVTLTKKKHIEQMKKLQAYLLDQVLKIPSVRLNGPLDLEKRICNNINVSFENLEAEVLLNRLSQKGICVSTGSACSSKSTKVSPVLLAIKCPAEFIHGNLRISISIYSTKKEVDYFIKSLKEILSEATAQKVFRN